MFLTTVPEVLPDRVNQDLGFGIIEKLAGCKCGVLVQVGGLTVKLVGAGFRDQVHVSQLARIPPRCSR
jgi:hypothetical protein